jgi:uncharacterized protein (TIGR02145 family)
MKFPRKMLASPVPFLGALATTLLLGSCQSTESVNSSGPQRIAFTLSVNRNSLQPDSASWEWKTKSGNANLGHDTSTLNIDYSVDFSIPSGLGTEPIYLLLWRNHMLTSRQEFTYDNNKAIPVGPGRDTLASIILDRLQGLNASKPTAFPLDQDSSIAKTLAVILVEGDTSFHDWTKTSPTGIDTARVRREALIYAASLGGPLASLVPTWSLGMGFEQARAALLALVPQHISASDTDALFPVPPVRVTENVTVASPLFSDSIPVLLHGKFVAKKRLFAPSFSVRQGAAEVKNHFEFVQQNSPSNSTTSWDLASDGIVTIRAYGNTEPGNYTLVVWIEDGSFGDSSKTEIQVLPKPDKQGPTLARVVPVNDTILSFADSIVTLSVNATDSSGVKSVKQGGRFLSKSGSVYQIVDTIAGNGTWTDLELVATDMLDNQSSIHVRFLRASPSSARPVATPLEPSSRTGDTIPTSQSTRHVVWRITDPVGIDGSTVLIDKKPATKIDDSTWSADVKIPPTGKATSIQVQALNTSHNGVVDSVVVVRRKDTKAPVIGSILGSRTVVFDTSSAKVSWKVSDDLKVDSVWIEGTPQALRADSVYTFPITTLSVNANKVHIRAKDSSGNVSQDSQIVTRLPNTTPPTLKRVSGTADMTVGYGMADSVQVRWIASGNEQIDSVAINGKKARSSRDTFYANIAVLPGQIPVTVRAWNRSGLSTGDSIAISVKLRDKDGNYYGIRTMPDGRIWMTQNLRTLPSQGSSTCANSDCLLYGATYTWSQAMALDASYNSTSAGYTATSQRQGICPSGWHVPTRSEWHNLFTSTMPASATDSTQTLRSDSGWTQWSCLSLARQLLTPIKEISPVVTPIKSLCFAAASNGTNKYDAFLRAAQGAIATGTWLNFWTAQDGATTTAVIENIDGGSVNAPVTTKTTPSSVRCIRDQLLIIKIPVIIKGPLTL